MSAMWRNFLKTLGIKIGSVSSTDRIPTDDHGDQKFSTEASSKGLSFNASAQNEIVLVEDTLIPKPLMTRNTSNHKAEVPTQSSDLQKKFPFNDPDLSPKARLRYCWSYLSWLARRFEEDHAKGQRAQDLLITSHRATLIELIVAGKMSEAIARDVQKSFDAVINNVNLRTMSVV